MKNIISLTVSITLILSLFSNFTLIEAADRTEERVYVTLDQADSYKSYIANYKDANKPLDEIVIEAPDYKAATDNSIEVLNDYAGYKGASLKTSDSGAVDWEFQVPADGLYSILVEYYPIEGRSASIQRTICIDGKLPFQEARTVTFDRVWTDLKDENGESLKFDKNGNHIRPEQVEQPTWRSQYVTDKIGYESGPLQFYFAGGTHTLTFKSVREPMVIKRIILKNQSELKKYSDLEKEYRENGYVPAAGGPQKFQAEKTTTKSDATIVPGFDRSTANTEPSSPKNLLLNIISGSSMQQNGQWAAWEFTVPETGLYTVSIKAIQNTVNGAVSSRRIYIDGAVPCEELNSIEFPYSMSWKTYTLGNDAGNYYFYLESGVTHELKMEVVLGKSAPLINEVSNSVKVLNKAYRDILVVTGPTPDSDRDYQFEKIMPEVIQSLKEQSELLKNIFTELSESAGMPGENVQIIAKICRQLDKMVKKPECIADQFSAFQSNITSLATWVSSACNQPLTLDYFIINPANSDIPKTSVSFFNQIAYHVSSFIHSFTQDYNNIDPDSDETAVKVWVGSGLTGGRDQAQIINNMINNYFTPQTGIKVNVSLVSMGSLLPATLAGKGPDVALSLASANIANYAFRNATEDISGYPGFDEVISNFNQSAIEPISFESGVYGLPETQTYPVLFYRKDILSELNIDIPQTWEDVIRILPVLQKRQLNFGLPTATGTGSSMTAFSMLLYQNGGSLYSENGAKSTIDSDAALNSFAFLTSLYNDYDLDQVIDFANRFRTGSVPIAIADYSMYNQLSVFAPELDGFWDFTVVPGIRDENGTINRTVPSNVTACTMLSKSQNKDNAWEFMKWWVSSEAQVKFGRELESVMGSAARYPTANNGARYQIPWTIETIETLDEQGKWTRAIPEVPGSYYTPRYIDFAFRDVVNLGQDAGEALATAVKSINFELAEKRREFGLPAE